MAASANLALSNALHTQIPSTRPSYAVFLSRRASRSSRPRNLRSAPLRCAARLPGPAGPLTPSSASKPGVPSPLPRRKSISRSSAPSLIHGLPPGGATSAAASSASSVSPDSDEVNWLAAGYPGSTKLTGRRPKDSRRSASNTREKRSQLRKATCQAAVTCIPTEEAVLASSLGITGLSAIPHFVSADPAPGLRGAQDLLEQAWLLPSPSLDDFLVPEGSERAESYTSPAEEGVEAFVGHVLAGRRRRGRQAHRDTEAELLSSEALSDAPVELPPPTDVEARLTQALAGALGCGADAPSHFDSIAEEGLSEEEEEEGRDEAESAVLVKFPEAGSSQHGVRASGLRRKSWDTGKRVLVRSMRKRRLSLGSRVILNRTVAPLDIAEVPPVQNAESSGTSVVSTRDLSQGGLVDPDRVLRGYGWKGDHNMEWEPSRKLLTAVEEEEVLCLLEQGQALNVTQARLTKELGRKPRAAEVAESAQCTVGEVIRVQHLLQASKNKLVMHNLGLVMSIAKMYRSMGYGVDFASLCQRGVRGLYAAAEKFSSKRKCRFSTFASICVRTVITREIAASMHIRAPTYTSYKFMQMRRAERQMEVSLGRNPTSQELAREIKVGEPQIKILRKLFLDHPALLHQDVKGLGVQLAEIVPDPEGEGKGENRQLAVGEAELESVRYALDDVIDSLRPKEAVVIRQRFGLDGYGERSLANIGRNLSVSREMVRKYEARALAKLQLPERAALFQTFLDDYE